ncbi:MAG: PepSY-associated TM helix domain-containing protein [Hylemonella sp.]|uniref:PepSY-associated TM helix domain-containing protein n=1 Tax=Hylemonella sp. TaxID=2066020 RepID=UPI003919A266
MHPRLRRIWLQAHTWLALSLGWLLALNALLGALLTVAKPLDQRFNAHLFVQPTLATAQPSASLESLRLRLAQELGPEANFTFRPPRTTGESLRVHVSGAWDGVVYFDHTGRELGRRGETEGLHNLIFELHSTVMLGDAGRALLAFVALSYLLLLLSGLVLWWPQRWPPNLKIRLRRGWHPALYDLHRTAGAVLGLLIAVSVATGAYMAWPPLRAAVSSLAGETQVKAPPVPQDSLQLPRRPLDELVSIAQTRFPGAMVGYVQAPAGEGKAVRVRFKVDDDSHPNGLSSVWLDPHTGEILSTYRWNELDTGSRIITVVYPLHTGELGGTPLTVLVGVGGLVLAGLGISGLWLWTRRTWPPARR